ncbi:MAG: Spo0E like sporulation regulatory protein [Firmicutes bacterium]|nr:Spo0E like sporulation regulatory protein [Bacillota bacterium]
MLSDKIERIAVNDIIEKLREKMHLLAGAYGLAHPQVLEVSQLLDCEISKFYRQGAKC